MKHFHNSILPIVMLIARFKAIIVSPLHHFVFRIKIRSIVCFKKLAFLKVQYTLHYLVLTMTQVIYILFFEL